MYSIPLRPDETIEYYILHELSIEKLHEVFRYMTSSIFLPRCYIHHIPKKLKPLDDKIISMKSINSAGQYNNTLFEQEVTAAMSHVCRSIHDLLSALPLTIRRPTDLRNAWKLDKKLIWQIYAIVNAGSPLSAARYVPGPPSLARFLAAASRFSIPAERIKAVHDSIESFNRLVCVHAQDRAEFDALIVGLSSSQINVKEEITNRKAAFKAESRIWGSQLHVSGYMVFHKLSASGGGPDICAITSKLGFHRLRPESPLRVYSYARHNDQNITRIASHSLDPDAARKYGAPILTEFSSTPLPALKTIETSSGINHVDVDGRSVGRNSAVDLTFGGYFPHSSEIPNSGAVGVLTSVPTECLIITLMIHRPSLGTPKMKLEVYRPSVGERTPSADMSFQFPIFEEVKFIGSGADCAYSTDIPRYADLALLACQKQNWNPGEFDVYRLKMVYPILNAMVRIDCNYNFPQHTAPIKSRTKK